ncbi:MAG: hypothetical protein WHV66_13700 [Anaerolineales bacterium]
MWLNPSQDLYTGVCGSSGGGKRLFGQVRYPRGQRSAHLVFISPASLLGSPSLLELLEALAIQAGERGALNVLVEVEERSSIVEALRRSGFIVYARQTVWKLDRTPPGSHADETLWQPARAADENAIRALYQCLAPPLAQSAETFPLQPAQGLVYRQGQEILAYLEGISGPLGTYFQPLVHPNVDNAAALLAEVLRHTPLDAKRPVYVAVRSYLAWLGDVLQELGAQASLSQALLVKYLGQLQRVPVTNGRRVTVESAQIEPSASCVGSLEQPFFTVSPNEEISSEPPQWAAQEVFQPGGGVVVS